MGKGNVFFWIRSPSDRGKGGGLRNAAKREERVANAGGEKPLVDSENSRQRRRGKDYREGVGEKTSLRSPL